MMASLSNRAIQKIAIRRIQNSKTRSVFMGIVILFATMILAFIASYAYNITHEYAAQTAYQAIYLNLSEDSISALQNDPRISSVGFYQSVGMTEKENGVTMGLVCSDENTMRLSNIVLSDGTMPEAADEILVEEGYLAAMQLDAQIGDPISVTYRNQASREMETYTFVIKGIISTTAESDANRIAYNAVVSSKFVQENEALSKQPLSAMIAVRDAGSYGNQELKELVQNIGAECGITADQIQVNNLYIDSNNASGGTVMTVLAVAAVLLGACALVIYNIFYISIVGNVTAFGQLRTIGATKKQIKKIVSIEGDRLALSFVPFGCLLGYVLAFLVDRQAFQAFTDFIIVLLSGIVAFIVVKLSAKKPAKVAMSISPIEAFKYSAYTGGKAETKKQHRLTPCSLALLNLCRNKRKSIMTFVSLALSGMLLVSLSSLLTSLDPTERAKQSFPYEASYTVELNRELLSPTVSITDLQADNPLTDELYQNLATVDGISEVICQKEIRVVLDGMETTIYGMNDYDKSALSSRLMAGTLPEPDAQSNNTLIVNISSPELGYLNKSYDVGDTVTFTLDGVGGQESIELVVAAIISDRNDASSFILPESVIEEIVPYSANSAYVLRATEEYSQATESAIQSMIAGVDALRLETLNDLIIQYESVFSTISVAVYSLLGFIAVFSIINLVNTCMTNIISRQKEIGLLRAVGLDHKQLSQMISIENAFQTFGSFLFSTILGLLAGQIICSFVQNIPGFNFVRYAFPLLPLLAYLLVVVFLQLGITMWADRYYRKSSVVEQIRTVD